MFFCKSQPLRANKYFNPLTPRGVRPGSLIPLATLARSVAVLFTEGYLFLLLVFFVYSIIYPLLLLPVLPIIIASYSLSLITSIVSGLPCSKQQDLEILSFAIRSPVSQIFSANAFIFALFSL